jgi:hypothetical protein
MVQGGGMKAISPPKPPRQIEMIFHVFLLRRRLHAVHSICNHNITFNHWVSSRAGDSSRDLFHIASKSTTPTLVLRIQEETEA